MSLSVIVITSPSPSNPAVSLIQSAIDSLVHVKIEIEHVYIICDGYVLCKENEKVASKKGKVSQSLANAYETYINNLESLYSRNKVNENSENGCAAANSIVDGEGNEESCTKYSVSVNRCPKHLGFAFAVQFGLKLVRQCTNNQYCLVCQHDRVFYRDVNQFECLINEMKRNVHIRYIGFPTSTSCGHEINLADTYKLHELTSAFPYQSNITSDGASAGITSPVIQLPITGLPPNTIAYLQPLVFWYDSQHLAHIDRYLEIFAPYSKMPKHIVPIVNSYRCRCHSGMSANLNSFLKAHMLLRNGDFIEDRYGQMQRNMLTSYGTSKYTTNTITAPNITHDGEQVEKSKEIETRRITELLSLVEWFGCYLYYEKTAAAVNTSISMAMSDMMYVKPKCYVTHIKGRTNDESGLKKRLHSITHME